MLRLKIIARDKGSKAKWASKDSKPCKYGGKVDTCKLKIVTWNGPFKREKVIKIHFVRIK